MPVNRQCGAKLPIIVQYIDLAFYSFLLHSSERSFLNLSIYQTQNTTALIISYRILRVESASGVLEGNVSEIEISTPKCLIYH